MKTKNSLSIGFMSIFMALVVFATSIPAIPVEAANNGPNKGGYLPARISFIDTVDGTARFWEVYSTNGTVEDGAYEGSDATYSEEKNTLTLKNFNHPTFGIVIDDMGDDFKLVLKGDNQIQYLHANAGDYGCSVSIKGTGSLTCNKNRKGDGLYGAGIIFIPKDTGSQIKIAKTCTVTVFCNSIKGYRENDSGEYVEVKLPGHPIYVSSSNTKNPTKVIKAKGKVTGGKYKVEKSNLVGYYDICSTGKKFISKRK